jgi:trk system potassium uptake protein TrkH
MLPTAIHPARLVLWSFAMAISVGALLLWLPVSNTEGIFTPPLTAYFTSTSAVCVTGLIVVDTATYWTPFGQAVILGLIQLGGLGIMTVSAFLVLAFGHRMGIVGQRVMQDVLDQKRAGSLRRFVAAIVGVTLVFESLGLLGLLYAWRERFPEQTTRLWHAAFHSVSGFCNAGFSTFSDNLSSFRGDWTTNFIIAGLIVVGGIGFPVLWNLGQALWGRVSERARRRRITTHTKIVVLTTVVLIVLGSVLIYISETDRAFKQMSLSDRALASVFTSISARTAGFNTVDVGLFGDATAFLLIILMFIGASPGSTGGGVKTAVVAVLAAHVRALFRNEKYVRVFHRTIDPIVVTRCFYVVVFSIAVITLLVFPMLLRSSARFLPTLFEATSAFGTVGLSMGLTPNLNPTGMLTVIALMFIGRVGPLTLAYSLATRKPPVELAYPTDHIIVG